MMTAQVPVCSVLIPTRGRVETLRGTIATFLEKAAAPELVEVIVRVHEDDPETMAWVPRRSKDIRVVVGDTELGYGSTDKFINSMAAVSNGDWLWMGADDHRMLSNGWDAVLAGRLKEPRKECLLLTARVVNWPNGRTPIMSRGLYRILGHMGRTGFADTYIDSLTHFAKVQADSGLEVRDEGLPPVEEGGRERLAKEGWAVYRGEENAWCFEMDMRKLGAVLGRDLGGWTPREAPERP